MMLQIASITDAFSDPQMRHAMLVHLPIAISVLAVPASLALLVTAGRCRSLRWFCFSLFLLGSICGYFTMESGEEAEDNVQTKLAFYDGLSVDAADVLHEHEELGEAVWWLMLIGAGLSLGTLVPMKNVRTVFAVLTFASAGVTSVWVAQTAHHGGMLVYKHGVGVMRTPNNFPSIHDGMGPEKLTPPKEQPQPDETVDEPQAPKPQPPAAEAEPDQEQSDDAGQE